MSVTGFPADAGGHPTKVGVAITDVVTGLLGAVGVLAALHAGVGQRIDVSLLEATLATLINQAQNAFATRRAAGRDWATLIPTSCPTRRSPRPTARSRSPSPRSVSGRGCARRWACPTLVDDPRFADNDVRVRHRDVLRPMLAASFATRSSADWLRRARRRPGSVRARSTTCSPLSISLRPWRARCASRSTIRALGPMRAGRHPVQAVGDAGIDSERAAVAG